MLPEQERDKLLELYDHEDRTALIEYICALRSRQWTLQDIANVLGVQRSTVQYWERKGKLGESVKKVTSSPKEIKNQGNQTVKTYILIPESDRIRLKDLSAQARKISNRTPDNSPLRQAAAELDQLIHKHLLRMVPVSKIAEAMGVTHRAVRSRIERNNLMV